MSLHDVIVLDDVEFQHNEDNDNELYNNNMRRKLHRNSRKCKRVSELLREVRALRKQNEMMSTLCGLKQFPHILNAAVRIQAFMRGWILRRDKYEFDKSVSIYLRNCRMFLARQRFTRLKNAVLTIQSHFRGFCKRKIPVAKAIVLMSKYKNDIMKLQALTLRLTSMICATQHLEKTQILVE